MTLPSTLQALKDQARAVRQEAAAVADEEAVACWQSLLEVARENLGPLWEHVSNMHARPRDFPQQGPPWGGQTYTVHIDLPGHRQILALFARADWNERTAPECAKWHRSYWPGATAADVEGGRANWMVSPVVGSGKLMTYYHTLGAALLAAEIEPPKRPAPRPHASDEPVPF